MRILSALIFIVSTVLNSQSLNDIFIQFENQHYLIIDSKGNKCGYSNNLSNFVDEISYLSYGDEHIGSVNREGTEAIDDNDPSLWTILFIRSPFDSIFTEKYRVILQGEKLNAYKGMLYIKTPAGLIDEKYSGIIDSGQTIEYEIKYSSVPNGILAAKKLVIPNSIEQDVGNYLKTGSIINKGIANSLQQKLENANKQKEKGQTKAAINLLQAFVNEVKAQLGKAVAKDAADLLIADAEQLIKEWGAQ